MYKKKYCYLKLWLNKLYIHYVGNPVNFFYSLTIKTWKLTNKIKTFVFDLN